MTRPATPQRRFLSPLAIFFAVCGVLIAALFVIALLDLAHDGGKPAFVRSNDLTSAMTSGAMLGLVAVAFLRVGRRDEAAPQADEPAARATSAPKAPGPVRARSGRRRKRRR